MQLLNNNARTRSMTQRRIVMAVMMVVMFFVIPTADLSAQRAGANGKSDSDKPKPRVVQLKTKDGFVLKAFYVPSEKGKDAVTVLLVHEMGGQASPYLEMVQTFSKAGFAVLVPVYRGHGDSTSYVDARGKAHKIDRSRMNKSDIQKIISIDLEKAKQFLKEENDAGNLNLNALVVVGVEDGCVLAANWAQVDWSFPSVGAIKQSQDVKALVLISPERLMKGISIDRALKDNNLLNLPIMIVASTGGAKARDTRRIAKTMENVKKRRSGGEAVGLKLLSRKTALSGPALIGQDKTISNEIAKFIQQNVPITDTDNPWIDRTRLTASPKWDRFPSLSTPLGRLPACHEKADDKPLSRSCGAVCSD